MLTLKRCQTGPLLHFSNNISIVADMEDKEGPAYDVSAEHIENYVLFFFKKDFDNHFITKFNCFSPNCRLRVR